MIGEVKGVIGTVHNKNATKLCLSDLLLLIIKYAHKTEANSHSSFRRQVRLSYLHILYPAPLPLRLWPFCMLPWNSAYISYSTTHNIFPKSI